MAAARLRRRLTRTLCCRPATTPPAQKPSQAFCFLADPFIPRPHIDGSAGDLRVGAMFCFKRAGQPFPAWRCA
jgi:hypothetical protein